VKLSHNEMKRFLAERGAASDYGVDEHHGWCKRRNYASSYFEITYLVCGDARRQIKLSCCVCRRTLGDLPKKLLSDDEQRALRVARVREPDEPEQCERCGEWTRCEIHHWAPRELFEDSEEWPKALLCSECHRRWHQVMNRGRPIAQPPEYEYEWRDPWLNIWTALIQENAAEEQDS
jgi:hypothetical protein